MKRLLQARCATQDEVKNIVNVASRLRNGQETDYYALVKINEERPDLYGCVSVNIKFVPARNSARPFELFVDTEGFFSQEQEALPFAVFHTAKDKEELYALIKDLEREAFAYAVLFLL